MGLPVRCLIADSVVTRTYFPLASFHLKEKFSAFLKFSAKIAPTLTTDDQAEHGQTSFRVRAFQFYYACIFRHDNASFIVFTDRLTDAILILLRSVATATAF